MRIQRVNAARSRWAGRGKSSSIRVDPEAAKALLSIPIATRRALASEGVMKAVEEYTERGKTMKNSEKTENPDYYLLPCGRYLIDFMVLKKLDFLSGSALKYIWRAGKKDGESKEKDMKKCDYYCEAISRVKGAPKMDVAVGIEVLCKQAAEWDGKESE